MPRKKRNGLFDFLKPRTTVYHVKRKRGPTETSTTRYKGYAICKRGSEGYSVPSLDRESTFDDKRQAKRFIDAMKKYNPSRSYKLMNWGGAEEFSSASDGNARRKAQLSADKHGITTLWRKNKKGLWKMIGKRIKPRSKNPTIGLPSNQFVNAKVRMKGGKIQVMADEKVLGKAGFKAGAGLSGVSVSGGAKLNPKRKRRKR